MASAPTQRIRRAGVATWVALVSLGGCAEVPLRPEAVHVASSGAHRAELSRSTSLGVVEIPSVQAHLNATLERLLAAAPPPAGAPGGVGIAISASPSVSAWSTDDTVYLPWRLLSYLESDDELAALLAHEAAHVLLRHTALDARTSLFGTLSAFGPLLVAGTPLAAAAVMVGGQYGDRAVAAGWAREQELQADAQGVSMLAAAGFRPSAMLDLLDNLDSLTARPPRAGPGPATRVEREATTTVTINVGELRFGDAERSHPDMDTRRDAIRRLLQETKDRPAQKPRASGVPQTSWAQVLGRPDVQAAFQGLDATHRALAMAAGALPANGDSPQALAEMALASPVGKSFVAYWAGAATLPADRQRRSAMVPLDVRLRQADTPVLAFLALMAFASQQNDWATAAETADLLRDRFDPDRGLYRVLGRVYANRSQQVAAYVDANMNRLSVLQALSLNGERIKRDLQATKMLALCKAAARSPNEMAGDGCS